MWRKLSKFAICLIMGIIPYSSHPNSEIKIEELGKYYCHVYTLQDKPKNGSFCPIVAPMSVPLHYPQSRVKVIEAYVILKFTVNEYGSTENIEIMDSKYVVSTPSNINNQDAKEKITKTDGKAFHRTAIKSVQKFKYRPRQMNGKGILTDDVYTKIDYKVD